MNDRLFRPIVSIVIGSLVLGALAGAQSPPLASPTFEVASVKPSKSGQFGIVFPPTGRFTATNADLFRLILAAYNFRQPYQVMGGPDWIKSDGFDVMAVVDGRVTRPVPSQEQREMLQKLLADRFRLQLHRETRELPIYRLVQMKRERGRGPSPTPSTLDCVALRAELERWMKSDRSGPRPTPCGLGGGIRSGEVTMSYLGMSMPQVAEALSSRVERLVVDATGLKGRFDIRVSVSESSYLSSPSPFGSTVQSNAPSLFVALEEQIGLRLESGRGPVEVLVIDQVERPKPD